MPPSAIIRALSRLPIRCVRPPLSLRSYKTVSHARQTPPASSSAKDRPNLKPSTGHSSTTGANTSAIQVDRSATVFSELDVLGSVPAPASAVETIFEDGFLLNNGVQFRDGSGVLLVHNDSFKWRPEATVKPEGGLLELDDDAWGMLEVITPKPELLIVGTGKRTLLLARKERDKIMELGMRVDVMDTTHAAAQYNLLATERPLGQIAAAMLVDDFGAK